MHKRTNRIVAVTAKAPTRIDLAGGTLDIWPLNLMFDSPITINMAIDIYAKATITPRHDAKIELRSEDQKVTKTFNDHNTIHHRHKLALLSRLAKFFLPPGVGATIVTRSDAPAGAGLAGSSALTIALCAALARATNRRMNKRKLMDVAKDIEASQLKIPTGLQDYGAALYGGLSAFSFPPGGIEHERIDNNRLKDQILLFYSGQSRNSGINNWEMFKRVIDNEPSAIKKFRTITACASRTAIALRNDDMHLMAKSINNEWAARRELFTGISTTAIDAAISSGRKAGAKAARICGAGGGGCFLLVAPPNTHTEVIKKVTSACNAKHLPFNMSRRGVQVSEL